MFILRNSMILILVISVACLGWAKELPDYIEPCNLEDPNFEECALEHGNKVIPIIVKGDKRFKIVNHAPLIIPEVILQASRDLLMKFKNFEINFEGTKLLSFKLDRVKQVMDVLAGKDFLLKGNYEINGRILLLPISGEGKFNASLHGLEVKYTCHYDFVNKNGDEYIHILDDHTNFTSIFSEFYFDNLFNGNKQLGDQMNKFLNENWKEFTEEFRPTVQKVMQSIIRNFMDSYITSIPYRKIFL